VTPSAEHEFEAARGLPEPLPAGERVLWQGAPAFASMVERVFHARTLAIYFAIILLARAATVWGQGGSASAGVVAALWLLPAALLALGNIALLAWLTSRTTIYTITDRRVVMRVGIVLTVTYNLPFTRIESASIQLGTAGTGDIALALAGTDRIAYLHLWPHARPWRLKKTEPSLRSIEDAAAVGRLLADAWSGARGIAIGAAAPATTGRVGSATLPGKAASPRPRALSTATR
jgi:hypothetical protein